MFRTSASRLFVRKIIKVSKPPVTGYELSELPNEKVLHDYMQHYRTKGVVVIVHSGNLGSSVTSAVPSANEKVSPTVHDPITRSFISALNALNLGNPDEVKLALVPGPQSPHLVEEYNILTFPTTLLFLDGVCMYRNVGARPRELSIKSLFMLRNGGRNIFSRE